MRALLLAAASVAACSSSRPAATPPAAVAAATAVPDPEPVAQDASARIEAAERALVEDPVRARFHVRATGAFEAQFIGSVVMDGDRIQIVASGVFGEQPVELGFAADGVRMKGSGGARAFDLAQPPGLREALGVGIMRMGLLHTLAMLVAGRPPDVPEDDVRSWLVLSLQPGAPTVAVMDPHHESLPPDPITFATRVAGEDSVTATVWIEEDVLLERQQETRFEAGTMQVREAFEPL